MLISLTVGKVDAGVAVLLTEDKRLIEFPSILLPPSITSGSIVDITVSRNLASESTSQKSFALLQSTILSTYGLSSPSPPNLRCRNATQTSIVLEWDPLSLATATLRSLSLYRNGAKAGNIPYQTNSPGKDPITSTKISGLAVDTPYTFHLLLRTTAGTSTSEKLVIHTQKMTDLTGVTITPGPMPAPLLSSLEKAVERIGMKWAETVRIDTTHFVCTEGRGREWEKALELNVPVVRPEWVEGCEREGRIVGVRGYYLGADPKLRNPGSSIGGQGGPQSIQSPQLQQRPSQQQQQQEQQEQQLPTRERDLAGNGTGEGGKDSETDTGSPPPPTPAKDYRPAATEASASADEPSDDEEEEEERDPEKSLKQPGLESQPVSPISPEAGASAGVMPVSSGSGKEEDEEGEGGSRTPGGFSEVAL